MKFSIQCALLITMIGCGKTSTTDNSELIERCQSNLRRLYAIVTTPIPGESATKIGGKSFYPGWLKDLERLKSTAGAEVLYCPATDPRQRVGWASNYIFNVPLTQAEANLHLSGDNPVVITCRHHRSRLNLDADPVLTGLPELQVLSDGTVKTVLQYSDSSGFVPGGKP